MKKLVVLLLASLVATSAFAVMDPDPDMIGLYFDTNAEIHCTTTPANIPFSIFLVATMPTPQAINAYEFGLNITVPDGVSYFKLSSESAGTGPIDVGVKDGLTGVGDYIVGLAEAVPTTEATVLHSWSFMQSGVTFPMQFFIAQASQPSIAGTTPVLQDADAQVLYQAGQSTGGADIPVAVVNDASFCPVGVEETSFGSVKSLFR